ncbi:DUF1573 domain-containing protein [Flavobacterium sp. HSC-61S13]|uniref:DUF1573 domain-containing protein n=1 Tax=Flavobacterium sp. HSC-61S13 TaxID=2910963 RepID=UPI00209F94F2|nr:DUF1573 domain-containing protein [Flavobacterium sp. HSC-61S13]MCP1995963.1 hypothetical protein [Flavobacterium sp. HSC-61S13]
MKRTLLLAAAIVLLAASCKENSATNRIDESTVAQTEVEQTATPTNAFPQIKFDREMHDFGNIANNERVETEFEVTNTGKADLLIINAQASCGCTVPEYQKTPIKPGETSKLKVAFTTSAVGQQQKTVTLTTNTEKGEEILTVKANVAPKQ